MAWLRHTLPVKQRQHGFVNIVCMLRYKLRNDILVIHGSLLASLLLTVQQAVEEHCLAAPHLACDTNNSMLEHGL